MSAEISPNRSVDGQNLQGSSPFEKLRTGKTAIFFQGQGSHGVGMGKELYDTYPSARMIYEAADLALPNLTYNDTAYKISDLSFNGPEEVLQQTRFAQLAILVRNHATYTVLQEQGKLPKPDFVAGLSLGELNAFVIAGAISFEDMLKVVDARAEAMQKACNENPSGKILISARRAPDGSLTHEQRLMYPAAKQKVLELGLYEGSLNAEGNIAFGGTLDQIAETKRIIDEEFRKYGIRAIILRVKGAFHTPLMASAVQDVVDALQKIPLKEATIPVVVNTIAQPITAPDEIRAEIERHVTQTVNWIDSLHYLKKNGVSTFIEIGKDPIISDMVKDPDQQKETIFTNEGVELAHQLVPAEIAA